MRDFDNRPKGIADMLLRLATITAIPFLIILVTMLIINAI